MGSRAGSRRFQAVRLRRKTLVKSAQIAIDADASLRQIAQSEATFPVQLAKFLYAAGAKHS
jgi:hypothetical protein